MKANKCMAKISNLKDSYFIVHQLCMHHINSQNPRTMAPARRLNGEQEKKKKICSCLNLQATFYSPNRLIVPHIWNCRLKNLT